ncbi:hypothetical protein C6P40_000240 [Pichia californica]|uniref:Uncharacterized protein n=1 Tax=Pichia californica TaxID=460514 RepID=A0A9P6WKU1_9ASCO|nr:hypothetical protein C6P42_000338 [[Candida] californica]KAG0689004.1 hypothetical protein C6P40_000240 [[Candida] californica]
MSTQIFPLEKHSTQELQDLTKKQAENEVSWYMREVTSSQLESIKDTLITCVKNLDETNDTQYKLPLSSHKSEILKGTVTRQNFKITGLHIVICSKHLNGGKKIEFQLKPSKYIIIRQLLDCHDAMENAISNLDKIVENSKVANSADLFVRYMNQVCSHVDLARQSLANPDPAYIFPKYRVSGFLFEPQLPKDILLDFLVNEGELTVEFKSLIIVDKKPWNVIIDNTNRLSFGDIVKKEISKQRGVPVNKTLSDEYNKYLKWREDHVDVESEDSGLGHTFKNMFTFNSDPSLSTLIKNASYYLEQSVTYIDDDNNSYVVQVGEKCEVISSDPVLLSICVKLESLEKTLHRIKENLTNIYI